MSDIIPFGKYRGQEIEQVRQRDPAYLQWLTQQAWFSEKFAPIYQLVVNNFAPPSEETPAHNALQVRFLDFGFQGAFVIASSFEFEWNEMKMNFLHRTADLRKAPKPCEDRTDSWVLRNHRRAVEEKWGTWRIRDKIAAQTIIDEAAFEDVTDVTFLVEYWVGFPCDADEVYRKRYNSERRVQFFIEIKPNMGDDYPAVLRQIKRQRQQREPNYGNVWFLLVDQFASQAVTIDQVRKIFARDDIGIVMMDDVRNQLIEMKRDG